jgi:hypothetical protein
LLIRKVVRRHVYFFPAGFSPTKKWSEFLNVEFRTSFTVTGKQKTNHREQN